MIRVRQNKIIYLPNVGNQLNGVYSLSAHQAITKSKVKQSSIQSSLLLSAVLKGHNIKVLHNQPMPTLIPHRKKILYFLTLP
jgi:hypothetical protein